jgi:hypothetical protein
MPQQARHLPPQPVPPPLLLLRALPLEVVRP